MPQNNNIHIVSQISTSILTLLKVRIKNYALQYTICNFKTYYIGLIIALAFVGTSYDEYHILQQQLQQLQQ